MTENGIQPNGIQMHRNGRHRNGMHRNGRHRNGAAIPFAMTLINEFSSSFSRGGRAECAQIQIFQGLENCPAEIY